jgi:hypothetical protein
MLQSTTRSLRQKGLSEAKNPGVSEAYKVLLPTVLKEDRK